MTLSKRLAKLEHRKPAVRYREAIILDDLIGAESLKEDESIVGIAELSWGEPHGKVWMRKKGEGLDQLRMRVGRDAG